MGLRIKPHRDTGRDQWKKTSIRFHFLPLIMQVSELLSGYVSHPGQDISEADSFKVSWQHFCRRGSFFGTEILQTVSRKFII